LLQLAKQLLTNHNKKNKYMPNPERKRNWRDKVGSFNGYKSMSAKANNVPTPPDTTKEAKINTLQEKLDEIKEEVEKIEKE